MNTHCQACGVPWTEHLGIQGTCEQLQAARQRHKEIDELRAAAMAWYHAQSDRRNGTRHSLAVWDAEDRLYDAAGRLEDK